MASLEEVMTGIVARRVRSRPAPIGLDALIVAWLAFPLLLALLALGCGLLVERSAAIRLPGVLLLPLGLALIVVLSQIVTYWDATAEVAAPLVVAAAVAGIALSRARLREARIDPWARAAAAAVFGVFAAPVVLSGEATFAGYTLLGDTSIHFSLIDHVMEHGRDVSGLRPSSYEAAIDAYLDSAYPLGAHTALGAVRPLTGQDVAWVFQPYLAVLAALTALSIYAIVLPVARSRAWSAFVACVSAQPALVFAYSLQGSVKEIATIWILALLVALVPVTVSATGGGLRRFVPLAVVTSASIGILSLAVAPWLGPLLGVAFLGLLVKQRFASNLRTLQEAAAFAIATAAISFPTLALSETFVRATKGVVTAPNELGNLAGPLDKLQLFGIWPSGDYRFEPGGGSLEVTYVLVAVAAAAALEGIAWALRTRAFGPLLFVGVSLAGWGYATTQGSPWVEAKALAIASPAVMVAALLGPLALARIGRIAEAAVLAAAIAFGVVWSNALAYHDVDLAPRDRLVELKDVGERISERGPTLYMEFEEFAKHFLRDADPTGWAEAWKPIAEGGRFGFSEDIDRVPLDYVLDHRALVLRRSPSISRPPAAYERTFTGDWYEVWERKGPLTVSTHTPLGDPIQASAAPRCPRLRRLAEQGARKRMRLAYVPRPSSAYLVPARLEFPPAWQVDGADPLTLRPAGPGRIDAEVLTRVPGRHRVWVQGSFGRGYRVSVDGKPAGRIEYELNPRGQYGLAGTVALAPGRHNVTIVRGGGDLRPGNGGSNRLLGPVVLSPVASEGRAVRYSRARDPRSLCRRALDWVELVR
jgi:hypothetical protein